ncbi:MAG: hypothetical protein KDE55_16900 [Novosphingobium sp.]|nr:hypothetical protein [Novosphingobium sp.]
MTILVSACAADKAPPAPPPPPPPVVNPVTHKPPPAPAYPGQKTKVQSAVDAERLLNNVGLTLQWISWDTRGSVAVSRNRGLWSLRGSQTEANGPGRLFLDGSITEIGDGYFTFEGTIRISDTPDRGRNCEKKKIWHFAVTQNRKYYRLREFEWCDDLTDYIDIYF